MILPRQSGTSGQAIPESVWRTIAPATDWAKISAAAHTPARRTRGSTSAEASAPGVPLRTVMIVTSARKPKASARCEVEMASGRR